MELKSDLQNEQQGKTVSTIEAKSIKNTLMWLIILSILILSLLVISLISRQRYTSLGDHLYIDERTGEVHNAWVEYDKKPK